MNFDEKGAFERGLLLFVVKALGLDCIGRGKRYAPLPSRSDRNCNRTHNHNGIASDDNISSRNVDPRHLSFTSCTTLGCASTLIDHPHTQGALSWGPRDVHPKISSRMKERAVKCRGSRLWNERRSDRRNNHRRPGETEQVSMTSRDLGHVKG
jgi:hypothetical protein